MRISTSKLYYQVCCFALFFLVAAASFNGYFDKWHFREAGTSQYLENNTFDNVLSGTATRPIVYRQLLPMTANWIDSRVPDRIKDRLLVSPINGGPTFLARLIDSPLAQNRAWFFRYWIVYAMVFLSAWAAAFALFQAGKALGYPPPAAALGAAAFMLLMPYFLTIGGYYYDYPELAFCAIAVCMAIKCDWWWIVPVAALATWNKETFLFFVLMLYPFLRMRNSRLGAITGTGVIAFVCAVVDCLLWVRYHHNPTFQDPSGNHPAAHLQFLLHFFSQRFRDATYGLPVNQVFVFVLLALIAWTAWRGWRRLPRAAQRHAQIGTVIIVPLYILFCTPGELRNFSLLYVTLTFLIAANLTEWMGNPHK
jgi:hypothetical protein